MRVYPCTLFILIKTFYPPLICHAVQDVFYKESVRFYKLSALLLFYLGKNKACIMQALF